MHPQRVLTLALLLRLRRGSEQTAQASLMAARAALAEARRGEAAAAQGVLRADEALRRTEVRGAVPAQVLQAAQALSVERRAALQAAVQAQREGRGRTAQLLSHVEQLRRGLVLAIGRREAAEQHEARERRGRALWRERRAEAIVDEMTGLRRKEEGAPREAGGMCAAGVIGTSQDCKLFRR
jgi:hypothetical protein